MTVDVVVVGSCNLDLVVRVPRHPRPGETVLGSEHFENPGGKGANQAVAAARLDAHVAMVGRLGDDDAGDQLRRALEHDGVDVSAVTTGRSPTGIALITVDDDGENVIVVSAGANDDVTDDVVDEHAELIADAGVCLLQLEIPLPAVARAAQRARGTVILNPAPARELPDELLAATDVLVPNATELAALTGADEPTGTAAAIARARELEFDGAVVVTLGAAGACVVTSDDAVTIAAPEIDAVDTTAAGDAFCGALASAIADGADLAEAARWAVAAGACAALANGAQQSLPDRAAVTDMLGELPDDGGS